MTKVFPVRIEPRVFSIDGDERTSSYLQPSTPHERLLELTVILANGIHRLREIPPVPPEFCGIPADSSPSDLEPVATTRPDGLCLQRESAEMNNVH
jgi:hypothetical protein